jgi:hypothetical protein
MKKLILASAAAFILTAGYANAGGIILGTDNNDRKLWINTWAGQSEDKVRDRLFGSSVSTFSGGRSPGASVSGMYKNTHEVWVRGSQRKQVNESVSTFSGGRSPGESVRGMFKNSHEVWIRR